MTAKICSQSEAKVIYQPLAATLPWTERPWPRASSNAFKHALMFGKHLGKKKKLSADTIVDSEDELDSLKESPPPTDSNDGPLLEDQTNAGGETFFELSKTRRITLRQWKGKALVDIREFWGDANSLKPGKKGISLTVEQWEQLIRIAPAISKRLGKTRSDS